MPEILNIFVKASKQIPVNPLLHHAKTGNISSYSHNLTLGISRIFKFPHDESKDNATTILLTENSTLAS
jgi:hypothetical protein